MDTEEMRRVAEQYGDTNVVLHAGMLLALLDRLERAESRVEVWERTLAQIEKGHGPEVGAEVLTEQDRNDIFAAFALGMKSAPDRVDSEKLGRKLVVALHRADRLATPEQPTGQEPQPAEERPCPTCNGRGEVPLKAGVRWGWCWCPDCGGDGTEGGGDG